MTVNLVVESTSAPVSDVKQRYGATCYHYLTTSRECTEECIHTSQFCLCWGVSQNLHFIIVNRHSLALCPSISLSGPEYRQPIPWWGQWIGLNVHWAACSWKVKLEIKGFSFESWPVSGLCKNRPTNTGIRRAYVDRSIWLSMIY